MSLRLRLTMLYSTLMGAILLVITALLLKQIDDTLGIAQEVIVDKISINQVGKVEARLDSTDISSEVYMQIWGLDGDLQSSFGKLKNFESRPFDRDGLKLDSPTYRDLSGLDWHIRVLNIPLEKDGHKVAVLQVASKLDVVDSARKSLTDILSIIWVVAVLFSGIAVWLTIGPTLKPLGAITETVEQINRADDLSRRIPYSGPEEDEIGSMVSSFNQTLERLEALFTSQQ